MNWMDDLKQARNHHQLGHFLEADAGYRRVLAQQPREFSALHLLGVVLHQQGRHRDALVWLERALGVGPKSSEAWANHGVVLLACGTPQAALASFDRALRIAPNNADTISNRANALFSLGCLDQAIQEYDRALSLNTSHINSWNNRGNSLQQAGRFEEAIESFNRALALSREFVEAWNNLGTLLRRLGRYEEALMCHSRAVTVKPGNADSWNRQAAVLLDLYRYQDALQAARHALTLAPAYPDAVINEGLSWLGIGKPGEALACFEKALRLHPGLPEGHYLSGIALQQLGRHEEAVPAFQETLSKNPHHRFALGGLATAAQQLCDWELAETLRGRLLAIGSDSAVVPPLVMLGYFDEPALLQRAARIGCPAPRQGLDTNFQTFDRTKIRIAYISGDFCEHATAHLTAGLFENHDRSRFEVFGISHGPNDQSAMRGRLVNAFDKFFDVSNRSDQDVVRGLRELDVDILVDLKGHTRNARTEIMAYRSAPVQVNFLGYPGTMGAPYIDYIIGDATVLPHEEQPWYDEAIVNLPCCYQPQDSVFTIGPRPSRASFGLPESAFVFCCFNNHWTLTKDVFNVWMDLLGSVKDSVIWLLVDTVAARARLRRCAEAKGIDSRRIMFADRCSREQHLARHACADLFLDTWPYGAHTTASDALRAGLPVITLAGLGFQGRVAASLLRALSFEQMICGSSDEYTALAARLASNPAALRHIEEKLRDDRPYEALSVANYCRYLETAFVHMHTACLNGQQPQPFTVSGEQRILMQCTTLDI
jgi:protein O-GlcNAc transferase